jgi:protein-S-isoprenylcysteine O-methyltransferase Ste14
MTTKSLFLLSAFSWIFLSGFVFRSVLVWIKSGINPIVLPRDDSVQGWTGRQFKVLLLTTLALMVASAAWTPRMLWPAGDIAHYLEVLGWLFISIACVLMPVAQHQMGIAWRIGFSKHQPTQLITCGVFSYSRNPIFLALRLALLGWLLVQPYAGSLVILVSAEILLQVQVRMEETHLSEQLGDTYYQYQKEVPRWW